MFNATVRPPSASALAALLRAQRGLAPTYSCRGGTSEARTPEGFEARGAEVPVGRGREAWEAARRALFDWRPFPRAWTRVHAGPGGLRPGLDLIVVIRALGLWWRAPARVVYVEDEPRRRAFAYGTLPGHPETGEERFSVEWRPDGEVVYAIRSFSRPRLLAARLAGPVTRALQDRFVRESLAAMGALREEVRG